MKLLLFLILSGTILAGCNAEAPTEEDGGEEEPQEEPAAEETNGNDDTDNTEEETSEDTSDESGDNAEETEPVDILEEASFTDGYWINYSGVDDPRGHMSRTDHMSYDPDKDYTITAPGYVTYYYDESFIKTNNYGHDTPYIIENVPEADRVIVSVDQTHLEEVALYDDALEDATSGGEENTTPEELVGRGQLVEEDLTGQIMFGQEFLSEENLTTGERIDENGNFIEDSAYHVTDALEYEASQNYVITTPAYVSYYNGADFIETVQIDDTPAYLPDVEGADYINISFKGDYIYELNVIEAEESG